VTSVTDGKGWTALQRLPSHRSHPMPGNYRVLSKCLKQRIGWCVIALVATWVYLLSCGSYGTCAATGAFALMAILAAVNQFVLNEITAEKITIIPDLMHDLRLDAD
jgi:hypothetical protein